MNCSKNVGIVTENRIEFLDIAKGIAILLVVMGHLVQYNMTGTSATTVFDFIYSFHMPLFFMLSGYVAALRSESTSPFKYVKKKFISLVIPYFVWGGIISPLIWSHSSYTKLPQLWFDLFVYMKDGAWFLIVLFAIQMYYLFVILIGKLFTLRYRGIGEILAFIFILSLVFIGSMYVDYIEKSTYFSFLFILSFAGGVVLCRLFHGNLPKGVIFVCFALFTINVWRFHFNASPSWLKLLLGMTGAILMIYTAQSMDRNSLSGIGTKLKKMIVFFGKNTIMIYLTHYLIVCVMKEILVDVSTINPIPLFIFCLIAGTFITTITIWISKVLQMVPYLSFCLYGKNASN